MNALNDIKTQRQALAEEIEHDRREIANKEAKLQAYDVVIQDWESRTNNQNFVTITLPSIERQRAIVSEVRVLSALSALGAPAQNEEVTKHLFPELNPGSSEFKDVQADVSAALTRLKGKACVKRAGGSNRYATWIVADYGKRFVSAVDGAENRTPAFFIT